MPGLLLGGDASPLGECVQYLDAPADAVVAALGAFPGTTVRQSPAGSFPGSLQALLPFEAPWTRELVLPCGAWTAYLNNGLGGGDPSAHGVAVAERLGVRCVVARHTPRSGRGHRVTALTVHGPDGAGGHGPRRVLSASTEDRRWRWHADGEPFAFEDVARYEGRSVRDRLDRDLLVTYLGRLGVPADDDGAYGDGVLVQNLVTWTRRSVTLEEARDERP